MELRIRRDWSGTEAEAEAKKRKTIVRRGRALARKTHLMGRRRTIPQGLFELRRSQKTTTMTKKWTTP